MCGGEVGRKSLSPPITGDDPPKQGSPLFCSPQLASRWQKNDSVDCTEPSESFIGYYKDGIKYNSVQDVFKWDEDILTPSILESNGKDTFGSDDVLKRPWSADERRERTKDEPLVYKLGRHSDMPYEPKRKGGRKDDDEQDNDDWKQKPHKISKTPKDEICGCFGCEGVWGTGNNRQVCGTHPEDRPKRCWRSARDYCGVASHYCGACARAGTRANWVEHEATHGAGFEFTTDSIDKTTKEFAAANFYPCPSPGLGRRVVVVGLCVLLAFLLLGLHCLFYRVIYSGTHAGSIQDQDRVFTVMSQNVEFVLLAVPNVDLNLDALPIYTLDNEEFLLVRSTVEDAEKASFLGPCTLTPAGHLPGLKRDFTHEEIGFYVKIASENVVPLISVGWSLTGYETAGGFEELRVEDPSSLLSAPAAVSQAGWNQLRNISAAKTQGPPMAYQAFYPQPVSASGEPKAAYAHPSAPALPLPSAAQAIPPTGAYPVLGNPPPDVFQMILEQNRNLAQIVEHLTKDKEKQGSLKIEPEMVTNRKSFETNLLKLSGPDTLESIIRKAEELTSRSAKIIGVQGVLREHFRERVPLTTRSEQLQLEVNMKLADLLMTGQIDAAKALIGRNLLFTELCALTDKDPEKLVPLLGEVIPPLHMYRAPSTIQHRLGTLPFSLSGVDLFASLNHYIVDQERMGRSFMKKTPE